jgi:hypothetical protein
MADRPVSVGSGRDASPRLPNDHALSNLQGRASFQTVPPHQVRQVDPVAVGDAGECLSAFDTVNDPLAVVRGL